MSARYRFPRPPARYESSQMGRLLAQMTDAINRIAEGVSSLEDRARSIELQLTPRLGADDLRPVGQTDFVQETDSGERARAYTYFTQGLGQITEVQSRTEAAGNIDAAAPWSSAIAFTEDATYPSGGYFLVDEALPLVPKSDLLTIEVRARDALENVWHHAIHTFDPDKEPSLRYTKLGVGAFNNGTGKFPVYLSYRGDEDTLSLDYNSATSPFAPDGDLDDSDFPSNNNAQYADALQIAEFNPSTPGGATVTAYFIGRARSGASGTGNKATEFARLSLQMPDDPRDPTLINSGSILAAQLEDSAKRASINIAASHGSTPATDLDYSGSIVYSDGTSYPLTPGTLTIDDAGFPLSFIYFDPAVSATALQITTTKSTATQITGRRIFVGIAQAGASGKKAFYVVTSDTPVITAPYIYAADLQALFASVGDLTIKDQLLLDTGGEFLFGTGSIGVDFTGLRIWHDGSVGRLGGYNSNTLEVHLDANGRLVAGGGAARMNQAGLQGKLDSRITKSNNDYYWVIQNNAMQLFKWVDPPGSGNLEGWIDDDEINVPGFIHDFDNEIGTFAYLQVDDDLTVIGNVTQTLNIRPASTHGILHAGRKDSKNAVDDLLGQITFGDDRSGASTQARIDGRRSATSTSDADLPSKISFWTVPDGSTTETLAGTFDHNQHLILEQTLKVNTIVGKGVNCTISPTTTLSLSGQVVDIKSGSFKVNDTGIGMHGSTPVAKATITGATVSAALTSLLSALSSRGDFTDSTTF